MHVELFLKAWGPLVAWRLKHARTVRRNESVLVFLKKKQLGLLLQIFSVWKENEGLLARLQLRVNPRIDWNLGVLVFGILPGTALFIVAEEDMWTSWERIEERHRSSLVQHSLWM